MWSKIVRWLWFPVSIGPVALVLVALVLSGCSVWRGDINPDSEMGARRFALRPAEQKEFLDYELSVGGSWLDADNASLTVREEFVPDGELERLLVREIVYVRGTAANANAGATVTSLAGEGGDLGAAITSAGTTVLIEALAAQVGIATAEIGAAIERARIEAEARKAEAEQPAPEPTPEPAP
jgi:hypothetical protein